MEVAQSLQMMQMLQVIGLREIIGEPTLFLKHFLQKH